MSVGWPDRQDPDARHPRCRHRHTTHTHGGRRIAERVSPTPLERAGGQARAVDRETRRRLHRACGDRGISKPLMKSHRERRRHRRPRGSLQKVCNEAFATGGRRSSGGICQVSLPARRQPASEPAGSRCKIRRFKVAAKWPHHGAPRGTRGDGVTGSSVGQSSQRRCPFSPSLPLLRPVGRGVLWSWARP